MRIRCPFAASATSRNSPIAAMPTVRRPPSLADGATDAWVDYVYNRDNPAGPHREYWYHAAGCRSWLVVTRDTRSHRDPRRRSPPEGTR